MKKVLYISNEDRSLGGSSLSLAAMLDSLRGRVQPVILLRSHGEVERFFAERGFECLVVPFMRGTFNHEGLSRAVRYVPHALHRFVVQRRCVREVTGRCRDIALVHSNSSTVDIGLDIARALGVAHVWHIREYMDLGLGMHPFPSWQSWKEKLAASAAVVTISRGLQERIGPGCICLPDAVCRASDAVMYPEKEPYVLFLAGTLSEAKNPLEALRVFARAGLGGHTLKMVGHVDEPMRASLEETARSLSARVQFLPFTENVKPLISKASALLVSSAYEGMGRVSVEAMFYGCPVVARNSGGSRDVLGEGRFGKLYGTVEEGAQALRETVFRFPFEQVRRAREEAVATYSLECYGEKMLSIYRPLW